MAIPVTQFHYSSTADECNDLFFFRKQIFYSCHNLLPCHIHQVEEISSEAYHCEREQNLELPPKSSFLKVIYPTATSKKSMSSAPRACVTERLLECKIIPVVLCSEKAAFFSNTFFVARLLPCAYNYRELALLYRGISNSTRRILPVFLTEVTACAACTYTV